MSSKNSLDVRAALATGTVLQYGTDGPVVISIRHLGTETVTSVIVHTGTDLELIGSTTTDTLLFATYTTIGALVDALNATGRWEAKVLDGLRSDASVNTLVNGTITSTTDDNGIVIWKVLADTSTLFQIAACLSTKRNFDSAGGHRVKLQQIVYNVNMGTAAVDSVQVWLRRGTIETQQFGALSVDSTLTTITFASGEGSIDGRNDDEIIVLVKDAAALADAAGNFVRIVGILE